MGNGKSRFYLDKFNYTISALKKTRIIEMDTQILKKVKDSNNSKKENVRA